MVFSSLKVSSSSDGLFLLFAKLIHGRLAKSDESGKHGNSRTVDHIE
jgi:hypothetical protein